MLYLVLGLVLAAFGLLITALTTANTLFAWVSVAVSVVAAGLLVADWLVGRRRAREAAEEADLARSERPFGDQTPPLAETASGGSSRLDPAGGARRTHPQQTEPHRTDPRRDDPRRDDPLQTDLSRTNPLQDDPLRDNLFLDNLLRDDPPPDGPSRTGVAGDDLSRTSPDGAETSRAGSAGDEDDLSLDNPVQTHLSQDDLSRDNLSRTDPARDDPAAAVLADRPAERPARRTPEDTGEPDEEPTDAADLLIVADLRFEVRVVDEHPRYHLRTCTYLADKPTIPLPVAEARQLGFTPCVRCGPDATLAAQHRATR